jgi:hypothetical protein
LVPLKLSLSHEGTESARCVIGPCRTVMISGILREELIGCKTGGIIVNVNTDRLACAFAKIHGPDEILSTLLVDISQEQNVLRSMCAL